MAISPRKANPSLLLPDAPIVAWWPHGAPKNASETSFGRIAHRRITDSAYEAEPQAVLKNFCRTYKSGDTDLAWTRLTNWRIQLAAVLDQVDSAPITAVTAVSDPAGTGVRGVQLSRTSGDIRLFRPGRTVAELTQPAQRISLPRRTLADCLAEELRCLDPDEVFGETVHSLGTSKKHREIRMTVTGSAKPEYDRFSLIAV